VCVGVWVRAWVRVNLEKRGRGDYCECASGWGCVRVCVRACVSLWMKEEAEFTVSLCVKESVCLSCLSVFFISSFSLPPSFSFSCSLSLSLSLLISLSLSVFPREFG